MENKFVEFLCKKAGWQFIDDGYRPIVVSPDENVMYAENLGGGWDPYYKTLLQEAIEGVNNSKSIWFILQDCSMVKAYPHAKEALNHPIKCFYLEHMSHEKAKLSALEFIHNQENKS